MKNIAGMLDNLPNIREEKQHRTSGNREQTRQLINNAFATFERTWPSHFQKLYPTSEKRLASKSLWRQSPEFCSLSPAQVEFAVIRATERFEYVPSLASFLKLCRESGETLAEQAWHEAVNHCHEVNTHLWSSSRVRQAGGLTGWYDIRNTTGNAMESVKSRYVKNFLALRLEASQASEKAIEDHVTNKSVTEQFERHSEIEIKNRVMADGCRNAKDMAAVMAVMGE